MHKLSSISMGVNIAIILSAKNKATLQFHRDMLLKLQNCIRFLARQSLPGHKKDCESMEGNLYYFLLLQSKDSPQLASWLKKREYISPPFVNEMITLCGNEI